MRPLTVLQVTPSVNLTEIAAQHQNDMPYLIQYFVNSLGRDAASCSDLMSYLLFTPKYTRELIRSWLSRCRRAHRRDRGLSVSSDGGSNQVVAASAYAEVARSAEAVRRRSTMPTR